MKKFFKTTGVCIGFILLNFVILFTLYFIKDINFIKGFNFLNEYTIELIGNIITLILIFLIFLKINYKIKHNIKEVLIKEYFNIKKIPKEEYFNIIILTIGLTILMMFLTNILTNFFPSYNDVSNKLSTLKESVILLITGIILIPIWEEIFFRGIIFGYLRKNYNIKISIIVQALIFGFVHLNFVQGIYAFISGIVFALVYLYSNSMLGNITMHIIYNLLGIIILPFLSTIPINGIVWLIIGCVCTTFSSVKFISKYNKNLFKP